MTDYSRIRRQWLAFFAGAISACLIALVLFISELGEILTGLGHAGHGAGALLLPIAAAMAVISLSNFAFPIVAGFVVASLTYDAYKLSDWRSNKFIALCLGATTLCGAWCRLATPRGPLGELLTEMKPGLSSAFALIVIFSALMFLPKRRTNV